MISQLKNIDKLFILWLQLSLALVLFIIIIGGLTRLTNSALSITEWELFKGILPPLNQSKWNEYFDLYKNIPQYKFINPSMTLQEFKVIFYWEYIHRVLARILGLFFIIPLIYYHFTNKEINLKPLYTVAILIMVQGIVGWYMVKSGLVNDVTVSHFRLSLHLSIAVIIVSILFWQILNYSQKKVKKFFNFSYNNILFLVLIFLIFLQIIIGAFVSGLDAGKLYQTWPLMGSNYFPDDFTIKNIFKLLDFENHSLVQFYHRNLAYFITAYVIILSYFTYTSNQYKFETPDILLITALFLQISLGIFTLLSDLHIILASAHQILSIILILSAINLYFYKIK